MGLNGAVVVASYLAFMGAAALLDYRRSKVAALLLLFGGTAFVSLTGASVPTFQPWDFYHGSFPEQITRYDLRVEDSDGNQIGYDPRATALGDAGVFGSVMSKMYDGFDPEMRRHVSCLLLDEGREYRRKVENGDLEPRLQAYGDKWTEESLAGMGEFSSISVYEVNLSLEGDRKVLSEREVGTYRCS